MQKPITGLCDLINDLTLKELEHLVDSGYNPDLQLHYWTDEQGKHFMYDQEIPQPE